MDNQVHDILLNFDEKGKYEHPSYFNYHTLYKKVTSLKKDLDCFFNIDFIVDNQIQDASFFCDLKIPKQLIENYKNELGYSIRISNFGKLVTINFEEELINEMADRIKRILKKSGFTYISYNHLDTIYDGSFEDFKNVYTNYKPTWYTRYFDYI
ncbi:hypothetical protein FUA48_16615 [Flavobacterium alkalisoli]|uniref:Uncharacterized protein n=1 Tax=Flavobacterium alkalisoli TaxID=2602769 RepID=A0A5B9FZ83_9FLAO|nr:hypothetical protein [Flavobacterium alkalisoli]QEE51138.1 hypothetical protein FUA48_16615 [Flavobacterium alkalisoli]